MNIEIPVITYIVETSEKVFKTHFDNTYDLEVWCEQLLTAKRKEDPNFKIYAVYSCSLINDITFN